jgi:hypothetical protein
MSATRFLTSIALLAFSLCQPGPSVTAQSTSGLLTDPTPYEIAYGMSFHDFDACGDSEAGRIFRRAVVEKLELCPFSPEAMAKFQEWRIGTLEGLLSDLWEAVSQGIKPAGPPELSVGQTNLDGTLMTCADYRSTPRYLKRRLDLLRYSRSELSVDQLLGEECPSGPASL